MTGCRPPGRRAENPLQLAIQLAELDDEDDYVAMSFSHVSLLHLSPDAISRPLPAKPAQLVTISTVITDPGDVLSRFPLYVVLLLLSRVLNCALS